MQKQCRSSYVSGLVTYNHTVLISRNTLLIGNSGDVIDKNSEFLGGNSPDPTKDDSSKTVYINDSYNLDTIPFDVDNIIDIENIED